MSSRNCPRTRHPDDRWRLEYVHPAGRGLVLVVEDEHAIAELIRLYLRREGFGVQVETDGLSGLAAVRSLRPVAVVLDVGLPGMDGIEVCRAMRADQDW